MLFQFTGYNWQLFLLSNQFITGMVHWPVSQLQGRIERFQETPFDSRTISINNQPQ